MVSLLLSFCQSIRAEAAVGVSAPLLIFYLPPLSFCYSLMTPILILLPSQVTSAPSASATKRMGT